MSLSSTLRGNKENLFFTYTFWALFIYKCIDLFFFFLMGVHMYKVKHEHSISYTIFNLGVPMDTSKPFSDQPTCFWHSPRQIITM